MLLVQVLRSLWRHTTWFESALAQKKNTIGLLRGPSLFECYKDTMLMILRGIWARGLQGAICLTSTFKVVGFERFFYIDLFLEEYTVGSNII